MSDNLNLKSMNKKVKISIHGNQFLIPSDSVSYDEYNNNEPYIWMRAKLCASIIKQFVKKEFPNLVVSATSETYSGGSSVRVSVCNKDGSSVNESDFKRISNWKYILQGIVSTVMWNTSYFMRILIIIPRFKNPDNCVTDMHSRIFHRQG